MFSCFASRIPIAFAVSAVLLLHCIQPAPAFQQANESDTVVAASNMLHPPFSSWDENKNAVGIEVEIVNEAAHTIGRKVQWNEMDFGDLFDAVKEEKISVAVSTIGITVARRAKVNFSDPYFETEIVALVAPDSKFQTLDDLADKKIGADQTTTSYVAALKRWPKSNITGKAFEGSTWPKMIHNGDVDAFIVDASDQERLESISDVKLRRIKQSLQKEQFAIAVGKHDERLLNAINESVKKHRPLVNLRIGGQYQFTTELGKKLFSHKSPNVKLVKNYWDAKQKHLANPNSADLLIWHGRRAGYLARMNEAIEIFTTGTEKHPEDARMYRHRGHRYISIRQFDKAIADLEKAAKLIENTEDKIEPDGAPNKLGIPLSTTHGNIWYHLGLAYYLKNDMQNALRCYRQRVKMQKNDDNIAANGHWMYMINRRLGNTMLAHESVNAVNEQMTIIENKSYQKMCLFYNHTLTLDDIQAKTTGEPNEDVILYGLGNWHLYEEGRNEKAKERFEQLFKDGSPYSFAYIAAESDYVRLFKTDNQSGNGSNQATND